LFEIFTWSEGRFDFEQTSISKDEDLGIELAVEETLKELDQREQEWQELKTKLPSTEVILQLAAAPARSQAEIVIKPEEWKIIYWLSSPKTVEELKRKTHFGTLSIYKVLARMLSTGLIEIAPKQERKIKTPGSTPKSAPEKVLSGKYIALPKKYILTEESDLPLEWQTYYERLNQQKLNQK